MLCKSTLAKVQANRRFAHFRKGSPFRAFCAIVTIALLAGCGSRPSFFTKGTPALDPLVAALITPATPRPESTPQPESTPPPVQAAPGDPAPSGGYIVQPGDTLLGIAMRHSVSMAAIQLANDLGDSTVVRVGQELTIPPPLHQDESPYWVIHIIHSGESLTRIASAYDVTVDDLLRVNPATDPDLIVVGQPLVIPLGGLFVTQIPTPTPAPTSTSTPAPTSTPVIRSTSLPTSTGALSTPRGVVIPPPTLAPMPTPQPQQPPTSVEISNWAGQVIELINQKRAAAGLPALVAAPELMHAAQAHAKDCSQREWGSHVGPDGANTLTRMRRAGYDATAWSENWVQALDPAQAVEWWYNETPPNDPHRKNILNPRFAEIGVGIAPSEEYGYYFIADFGRR